MVFYQFVYPNGSLLVYPRNFYMRKIEILTREEQQAFDNPPHFTLSEQKIYFVLPEDVDTWAKAIVMPSYLVGFILLWGYAKSQCKFFNPKRFHPSDIKYVCDSLRIDPNTLDYTAYNQRTYSYHKQFIRKQLQIRPFDEAAIAFFTEAVQDKVTRHQSPKQILYEIAELCIKNELKFLAIIDSLQSFHLN